VLWLSLIDLKNKKMTLRKSLMKIYRLIVPLLLFLTVSAYANDNEVEGFTEDDCEGDSHTAASYSELKDMHKSDDNEWKFKSYWYTNDKKKCLIFEEDMEEITVIGIRLPSIPTSISGDSGKRGGRGPRIDYDGVNPAETEEDFNDKDNEDAFDCWTKGIIDPDTGDELIKEITEWKGEYTEATYIHNHAERGEQWVLDFDEDYSFGWTNYPPAWKISGKNFFITVFMYPERIGNEYLRLNKKVPFLHLYMYWQMHEFVHVLQIVHELTDGDDQLVPYKSGKFYREMEAYKTVDEWWRARFGNEPPYKVPNITAPDDYNDRVTAYNNLVDKRINGTFEESDPNDEEDQTQDEKDWKELLEYFDENHPDLDDNDTYNRRKAKIDCD